MLEQCPLHGDNAYRRRFQAAANYIADSLKVGRGYKCVSFIDEG